MRKHIVFVVRYSVLNPGPNREWVLAKNAESLEGYRASLFSASRMALREATMEHVTVSSLKVQELDGSYDPLLLVLVSDALPPANLARLRDIVDDLRVSAGFEVRIVAVRSTVSNEDLGLKVYESNVEALVDVCSKVVAEGDGPALLATARLDDDDAVSSSFCSALAAHMSRGTVGYAVSFAQGFEASFDHAQKKFYDFRHTYEPKNAQGLAVVDMLKSPGRAPARHIFNIGNHRLADEKVPVLVDARRPMFIRGRTGDNDTGRHARLDMLPGLESAALVAENFPSVVMRDEDLESLSKSRPGRLSAVKYASVSAAYAKLFRREMRGKNRKIDEAIEALRGGGRDMPVDSVVDVIKLLRRARKKGEDV